MAYYDDPKNVEQYIQMAEGYDGKLLIAVLRQHLPNGETVLELGMGAGKDLLLLAEHYTVTGSDHSRAFLDRFRKLHPDINVLELNAVTLQTERQFDAIYSNKVLYHLTADQLRESLQRQAQILKPGGIALHSFWHGDGSEDMHGLHFAYYTEASLRQYIGDEYSILTMQRYTEMHEDDSLYVILKKD